MEVAAQIRQAALQFIGCGRSAVRHRRCSGQRRAVALANTVVVPESVLVPQGVAGPKSEGPVLATPTGGETLSALPTLTWPTWRGTLA
jgi:hypothetical protein